MRGFVVSFLFSHFLGVRGGSAGVGSRMVDLMLTFFFGLGRAVAVLGNGGSFDLCDDFDGLEGTREILAAYTRGVFGDQTTREERKKGEPKLEYLLPNDGEEIGIAI